MLSRSQAKGGAYKPVLWNDPKRLTFEHLRGHCSDGDEHIA